MPLNDLEGDFWCLKPFQLPHLVKHSKNKNWLTQHVARSLCGSWAFCVTAPCNGATPKINSNVHVRFRHNTPTSQTNTQTQPYSRRVRVGDYRRRSRGWGGHRLANEEVRKGAPCTLPSPTLTPVDLTVFSVLCCLYCQMLCRFPCTGLKYSSLFTSNDSNVDTWPWDWEAQYSLYSTELCR